MLADDIHYMVFGGGGTRGIAYAGLIDEWAKLTKYNFQLSLKGAAGTSIGALYAAALVSGMEPAQLLKVASSTNMVDIINVDLTNLMSLWGLDSGKSLETWIASYIGDFTFEQLYHRTGRELELVVTNLNTSKPEYLSYKTVPEMKVAKGVMMSMSLPPVFGPTMYRDHYYVDGGLLDNYPIRRFPAHETLGFKVKWSDVPTLNSFEHYVSRVTYCATVTGSERAFESLSSAYKKHSIAIDCGDVPTINWRLPPTMISQCITQGRRAIRAFVLENDVKSAGSASRTRTFGTQTGQEVVTEENKV